MERERKPFAEGPDTLVEDLHADGFIPAIRMLEPTAEAFEPYIERLLESGRAEIVEEVEFDDGSFQTIIRLVEDDPTEGIDLYEHREWTDQI